MHFKSSSDPSQTAAAEAKPRYVYLILKPHGQSSGSPVRQMLHEAKPSYVYWILKPHGQSSELVPSSCVRYHIQDVSPKRVLPCVNINARRVTFVYFFTQLYFRQIRRIISLVWQLLCYASGYKQVNVCWVLSKTIQSTYIFLHNTSLYVQNKAPILTLNILLF